MKRLRRRQTVVLEVAALISVLAASGWWNRSPGGTRGAVIIVLAAASVFRLHHESQRLRSSRLRYASSIAALAIVAFALNATTVFALALALMAGVVCVYTNPRMHRALSERLRWRHARAHTPPVMLDEA
jgi:hypothetical protein